jgi:hypothetical protein
MAATLTRILKPGDYGADVQGVRRGVRRYLGVGPPTAPTATQRAFNASMTALVKAAQADAGLPQSGWVGPRLMEELRAADAFDTLAVSLLEQYADEHERDVPPLGPIVSGGTSVLLHDLTHRTAGFPRPGHDTYYPAFDDGFGRTGAGVLAPEPLVVTRQSSAQGGDAFYAEGVSGLRYWIGHVAAAPATGSRWGKGQAMARIGAIGAGDGGPHVHVGIDAKAVIGRDLLHHTNYTHGAPTVGVQLKAG